MLYTKANIPVKKHETIHLWALNREHLLNEKYDLIAELTSFPPHLLSSHHYVTNFPTPNNNDKKVGKTSHENQPFWQPVDKDEKEQTLGRA